jgi:1-deoxy-D-xylulose-5-phosphate synthase
VPTQFGEAPPFERGVARLLREGIDATILAYGSSVAPAMEAADLLASQDIFVRVYNARFARPIDTNMLRAVLTPPVGNQDIHPVLTVEEHSTTGGFGTAVLEAAQELGLPTQAIVRLGMPADRFIRHGSRVGQLAECGIDEAGIAAAVTEALNLERRRPHRAEPPSVQRTNLLVVPPPPILSRAGNPNPRSTNS